MTSELRNAVGTALSMLLQSEMTLFLGKPEQYDNKINGYKVRDYALKGVGCIRIKMPQDRKSEFKSAIIKPNEQIDPRLKEDMAMISRRVLGVQVSTDTVSESLGTIEEKALKFLTRPINDRYWALFVDGTNFRIQRRGTTDKEPSLVVLGLDERNCFSILAVEPGTVVAPN